MKTNEELKKMELEGLRAHRNDLNLKKVDKDYLNKVDSLISILEADSINLYEEMQEIETIELRGGSREGAGRKATGIKRNEKITFKLSIDELKTAKEFLEKIKEKENLKNNSDVLLKLIDFYNEN